MLRVFAVLLALSCWLLSSDAQARTERFAIVVGNDRGLPSEVALRYAQTDASKVADVLRELGGFAPANMVVLAGQDADTLRQTLITVNDRVRTAVSQPDTDVVLVVYYSGHADAEALHLGSTRFPMSELAQLVRGSAATFRLLVVDACRSGQLTRRKGGKIRAPFPLAPEAQLSGEGLAFLTASSAHEDAQESDELKGSFFTHALVSGLLGAADRDGDGSVVLDEAYRYAYDATLRSTSRTAYGTQHPTFHYDLRGRGDLVLTETVSARHQRGNLTLEKGVDALLFRDNANGPVIAELVPNGQARTLSLAPGIYFVRVRSDAYLLEGRVSVDAGTNATVDTGKLTRIEYARLVRKGGAGPLLSHGVELGGRIRSRLPNAETLCPGVVLGHRLDLTQVSVSTRFGFCASRFGNDNLEAKVREFDLSFRVGHAWDISSITIELGAGAAYALFMQSFESQGLAPDRESSAGSVGAYAALLIDLKQGAYLGVDVEAQLYALDLFEDSRDHWRVALAGRCSAFAGKHF